jgi:ferrochelatase
MTDAVGVLVMAHGTPASPEEVLDFYTRIRRGRAPSPEQLSDLQRRYDAIGGLSPLAELTRAQVSALRAVLSARDGDRFMVAFGAKHTEPSIEDAAKDLQDAGVRNIIGLVLTPHGSSSGSQEYVERAEAALGPGCGFIAVPPWFAQPGLVRLLAERVTDALRSLNRGDDPLQRPVIFTAHSVPERVSALGDTYPEQLQESARLVAETVGTPRWLVAWQSAGRTPEPWLGPDVRDMVRQLAETGGDEAFVVCPIGFVSDHLEVLYDLDVELAAVASEVGMRMARTASLNDDPRFIEVLADVVCAADASRG